MGCGGWGSILYTSTKLAPILLCPFNNRMDPVYDLLKAKGRPLSSFKKGDTIYVNNKMQKGYAYTLQEDPGTNFQADFKPYLTPGEVLALGSFEGKYLNDCSLEYPAEWFLQAGSLDKLHPEAPDASTNYFQIKSRLGLQAWREKGWVPPGPGQRRHISDQHPLLSDIKQNPDLRGWFEWYCRYWMGRRIPPLDEIQIKRWKSFVRHSGAIKANCAAGDLTCRPKQRQALLHWAHNPFL